MRSIEFFVPGDPHGRDERSRSWKDKRTGGVHTGVYTTSKGETWRDTIATYALKCPNRPTERIHGPVTLTLIFVRERPAGHHLGGDLRRELSAEGLRHPRPTSKPDLDNCEKPVKDVLKRIGWLHDDAQVVTMLSEKRWCSSDTGPGVFVTVRFEPMPEVAPAPPKPRTERKRRSNPAPEPELALEGGPQG